MEYPAHCRNCGLDFESEDAIRGSLDWFGDQDETFCPACHSDDLRFDKPREDEMRGREEDRDLFPDEYDA